MTRRASGSFAFVIAVGAWSCSATSPDYLSATTTVTSAQFRAGDSISVHVVVKNTGSQSRSILANACPDAFVVVSSAGVVVGPGDQVCTLSAELVTLEPDQEYSWTQGWAGDGSAGAVGKPSPLLSPGVYTVRARIIDGGSRNPGTTVNVIP